MNQIILQTNKLGICSQKICKSNLSEKLRKEGKFFLHPSFPYPPPNHPNLEVRDTACGLGYFLSIRLNNMNKLFEHLFSFITEYHGSVVYPVL